MYTPDINILAMDFTVRSENCLKKLGIKTTNDLIKYIEEDENNDLIKVRNLGRKTLAEIIGKLYIYTGKDYRDKYGVSPCNFWGRV